MNPGTPQMGNSSQATIGSRYAETNKYFKPKQPIKLETTEEILSGTAVNKKSLTPKNLQVPR